jgi:hypothetical protein
LYRDLLRQRGMALNVLISGPEPDGTRDEDLPAWGEAPYLGLVAAVSRSTTGSG